ncbi:MAG: GntR family transcriptional regulator [Clostridia bacterium]|nr:GntR family transcriptional regulator [Clostridia bacterium]
MIQLDLKSRKSIYEQIMDGFKELISRGILKAGDKLPSVRELSRTLTVNPNTIQKAYRQLESDGYIYTVSGLGCFASDRPGAPDLGKAEAIYETIEDCVRQLRYVGVTDEEIRGRLLAIAGGREEKG